MVLSPDLIKKTYGHRLRLRVSGLCIHGDKILMIRHQGLSEKGYFLSPPGGGLQFGEDVKECLQREFQEETNLHVLVQEFLFVHEFLNPPLHALELFFIVKPLEGEPSPGIDPEMKENQMIDQVKYMSYEDISREKGVQLHAIFNICSSLNELLQLRGYFKFDNKARY